jgi:hypothetical protein
MDNDLLPIFTMHKLYHPYAPGHGRRLEMNRLLDDGTGRAGRTSFFPKRQLKMNPTSVQD